MGSIQTWEFCHFLSCVAPKMGESLKVVRFPEPEQRFLLLLFFPLSDLPLDMCFVADPRASVTLGSCRAHGILTRQKPKGRMTQCGFASSFCFFH